MSGPFDAKSLAVFRLGGNRIWPTCLRPHEVLCQRRPAADESLVFVNLVLDRIHKGDPSTAALVAELERQKVDLSKVKIS